MLCEIHLLAFLPRPLLNMYGIHEAPVSSQLAQIKHKDWKQGQMVSLALSKSPNTNTSKAPNEYVQITKKHETNKKQTQNVLTTLVHVINQRSSPPHLGLLKVEVLADGGEQPAQTLQRLLIVVLQQLDDTVMHDGLRQHLELKELADELDVADGTPPGLVLGFLQLFLHPVTLCRLRRTKKTGIKYLAL